MRERFKGTPKQSETTEDINFTLTLFTLVNGAIGTNGSAGSKPFANGLAAFKSLDSNNDNQFTAADAQWANVKVWVDANHDGITDTGEFKILSSLNITAINLTQTTQSGLVRDGNEILASSTGTLTTTEGNVKSYTAGNTGEAVDVAQKGVNNAQGGAGHYMPTRNSVNDSELMLVA